MSLEGITYLDEVLQKKSTKTQKMRFWYIAQKIIFHKNFNGNENKKLEKFFNFFQNFLQFLWKCIEIFFSFEIVKELKKIFFLKKFKISKMIK